LANPTGANRHLRAAALYLGALLISVIANSTDTLLPNTYFVLLIAVDKIDFSNLYILKPSCQCDFFNFQSLMFVFE
jgi:hypothetical protein